MSRRRSSQRALLRSRRWSSPRVFFTNSGSEAVDAAIKVARSAQIRARRPERVLVVAREHAYHGTTYGGTSAQGLPANQQGFGPLVPGFVHIPNNDLAAVEMILRAIAARSLP